MEIETVQDLLEFLKDRDPLERVGQVLGMRVDYVDREGQRRGALGMDRAEIMGTRVVVRVDLGEV